MSAPQRKLVTDLPQFSVSTVTRWNDEHSTYDLTGHFDRTQSVREGMCWLLLTDDQNYYGELSSFDAETGTAKFRTHVKGNPIFESKGFYYLSAYWQAYHVWMVTDECRLWEKLIFRASDAVSDTFEDGGGARLRRIRKAASGESEDPNLQIIRDGWDHEHCELCSGHIDPGDLYYGDQADHWVCTRCYERYVLTHDLAFVDGL